MSYVPSKGSRVPRHLLLALLNSNLLEWYFRLGSTNSKVNEYQFRNLPCPRLSYARSASDRCLADSALSAVRQGRLCEVPGILATALERPPFPLSVVRTILGATRRIVDIETSRGDIARNERSALAPEAQPYQDLINVLLYKMAGLTDEEQRGVEQRLEEML